MSNQADYLKVHEHVIKSLERHYGKAFDSETIADYVDDFARFDAETLKKAMAEVRQSHNRQTRPAPGVIFEAIRKIRGDKGTGDGGSLEKLRQEQDARFNRTRASAKQYVEHFCMGNDRLKAIQPDWRREEMIDCIHQAALLQAQLIEGIKNCSYTTASWLRVGEGMNHEERLKWWVDMCRRNAKTGQINVEIPWLWYESKQAA